MNRPGWLTRWMVWMGWLPFGLILTLATWAAPGSARAQEVNLVTHGVEAASPFHRTLAFGTRW
jgi:hypothetical protein